MHVIVTWPTWNHMNLYTLHCGMADSGMHNSFLIRVPNDKVNINETNWMPIKPVHKSTPTYI